MSWKEFLRPDWKKILITILLIILFSIGVQPYLTHPAVIKRYDPFTLMLSRIFGPFYTYQSTYLEYVFFGFEILVFILIAIEFYVFSCLIVWIYNKFKRK